ncbi:MAG: D-alanyl-D-alanine carboxypeptidase family protein, partial [Acidimicrobiales bacterium]
GRLPTLAAAMEPAHRRESAQTYRLRRAMAATLAVLVTFALLNLTGVVGGDGGGADDASPTPTSETTSTTIPPPPACAEADVVVPDNPNTAWATVLIDTARALPDWYAPGDLHNIADAGFPFTDGLAVRGLVVADLGALREAAAANGTPLSILAAFRSHAQQADLFDRRVDELGDSEAGSRVARPGHSEHQLGTTIDVTSEGETDVDQAWGATPPGQWVATHAHEFGFLISYPLDASDRTCYDYEPWHLRYVGRELAAAVIDSGLTLREYLWRLNPVDITASASTTTSSTAPG